MNEVSRGHNAPLIGLGASLASLLVSCQTLPKEPVGSPELAQSTLPALTQRTIFVSPDGNERHDVPKSTTSVLSSLAELSGVELFPGDSVMLAGGATYHGNLEIHVAGGGDPERPVSIYSIGAEPATIISSHGPAIRAANAHGIDLHDLTIRAAGAAQTQSDGILLEAHSQNGERYRGIHISDVEVSGFGFSGIKLSGGGNKSGFEGAIVERVHLHDNRHAGFELAGTYKDPTRFSHSNVVLRFSSLHDNLGIPGIPASGNGAVMSDVDGGRVYACVVFNNGWHCTDPKFGPCGIMFFGAIHSHINYCISGFNGTGCGSVDGVGGDLDGNVRDSEISYFFTFGNFGSGAMIGTYPGSLSTTNCQIHHTLSLFDGKSGRDSSLKVWGRVSDSSLHSNVVVAGRSVNAPRGTRAVSVSCLEGKEVSVARNVFVTTAAPAVHGAQVPGARIGNNLIYELSLPFFRTTPAPARVADVNP